MTKSEDIAWSTDACDIGEAQFALIEGVGLVFLTLRACFNCMVYSGITERA